MFKLYSFLNEFTLKKCLVWYFCTVPDRRPTYSTYCLNSVCVLFVSYKDLACFIGRFKCICF